MIIGAKVTLRPFTREDLEWFERWTNDAAYLGEYNNFGLKPAEHLAEYLLATYTPLTPCPLCHTPLTPCPLCHGERGGITLLK